MSPLGGPLGHASQQLEIDINTTYNRLNQEIEALHFYEDRHMQALAEWGPPPTNLAHPLPQPAVYQLLWPRGYNNYRLGGTDNIAADISLYQDQKMPSGVEMAYGDPDSPTGERLVEFDVYLWNHPERYSSLLTPDIMPDWDNLPPMIAAQDPNEPGHGYARLYHGRFNPALYLDPEHLETELGGGPGSP
jgi:hypothetical protein